MKEPIRRDGINYAYLANRSPKSTIEDLLKAANDASAQARNTWFAYILLTAYLGITVGATTHKQLLLENPIELPLLNAKLPLLVFYRLVPIIFALVHIYTLVQFYLLSRLLHVFNTKLIKCAPFRSVSEELRARVDAFILSQLISGAHRGELVELSVRLSVWVSLLIAPALLLLMFQVQFLPYHDAATTGSTGQSSRLTLHPFGCCGLELFILLAFYRVSSSGGSEAYFGPMAGCIATNWHVKGA